MPCEYHESPHEIAERLRLEKERWDRLARVACEACKLLGDDRISSEGTAELAAWWAEHKAADKVREAAEAAARELKGKRAAALMKLTPDERAALGLERQ